MSQSFNDQFILEMESVFNPAGVDEAIAAMQAVGLTVDQVMTSIAKMAWAMDSADTALFATGASLQTVAASEIVAADSAMTLGQVWQTLVGVATAVSAAMADESNIFDMASVALDALGVSTGPVIQALDNLDIAYTSFTLSVEGGSNVFYAASNALTELGVRGGFLVPVLEALGSATDFLGNAFTGMGEKAAVADKELRTKGTDATNSGYRLLMLIQIVGMLAVGFIRMGMAAQDAIARVVGLADQSLRGAAGAAKLDGVISVLTTDSLKFGMTLDQAAKGLYYLISSGMSTANALLFLGTAMEAAKGLTVSFDVVALGLTSVMNAYGLTVQQATAMTNQYVQAVVSGRQDPTLFANAIGGVAASAKSAGVSLGELFAAEARLTQINPRVRQDAQNLSHTFDELAIKSTDLAAKARSLGGSFTDAQFAALPLIDKLKYLGSVAGGDTIANFHKLGLTATSARVAFDLLADHGQHYADILKKMGSSSNALAVAFQTQEATLTASFQHIGAALSVLSYQLIIFASPIIKPFLDGIGQAIGFIAANANIAIPVFTVLAVLIGGILVVAVGTLLASLAGIIGTVWAVVVPIAALAGGVVALIKNWGGISAALSSVFPGLKYTGDQIQMIAQYLSGMFNTAVSKAGPLLQQLGGWITANVLPVLKQLGTHLIQDADWILAKVIPALSSMQSSLAPVGNFIMSVVVPALGQFVMWILRAADFIAANFVPILRGIGAVLGPVVSFFVMLGTAIFNTLLPPLKIAWAVIMTQLVPAFQGFIATMAPLMPGLLGVAKVIGGILVVAIGLLLSVIVGIIGALAGMVPGIVMVFTGIVNVIIGVVQIISGILSLIADIFTGKWKNIANDLVAIVSGIVKIFLGMGQAIGGIVLAFVGLVVGFFNGFVQTIVRFFIWLYHTVVGGSIIPDFVNGIIRWITMLITQGPTLIGNMAIALVNLLLQMGVKILSNITQTVTNFLVQIGLLPPGAAKFINDMVTTILSILANLASSMFKAAVHAVQSFINGLLSMVGAVAQAAGKIAAGIAGALHHSKPDWGPMADDDTWMPHFGQQLVTGLTAQIPLVRAAATSLAYSIAAPFTGNLSGLSQGINTSNVLLSQILGAIQKQQSGRIQVGPQANMARLNTVSQVFNTTVSGVQDLASMQAHLNRLGGRKLERAARGAAL